MKTTFDIADNILSKARQLSRKESIPLKLLVEEGLETVLKRYAEQTQAKVSPVTCGGNGLSKDFESASWSEIRNAAYESQDSQ